MRTVLVTGINGFIGHTLYKKMLAGGRQVRGTVRGQEKTEVGCLRSDVGGLRAEVGDISPDTDWSKALNGVDTVVHLAARVRVMNDTIADPHAAFRWVNTKGTERLARQAVDANVRRFFYMSSIKVSGERTGDNPQITQITRIRKKRTEVRGRRSDVGGRRVEVAPVKCASLSLT